MKILGVYKNNTLNSGFQPFPPQKSSLLSKKQECCDPRPQPTVSPPNPQRKALKQTCICS